DYSSATTYSWVKDTAAPTGPSITVAGGAAYTNTDDVALTLSAGDSPDEMYITNTAGCGSDGNWIAYNTNHASWTLGQTNATATVYVKFRDEALNESGCVSDTIVHDDQNPDPVTSLTLGATPEGLTASPTITYTASVDNGPAG